MNHNAEFYVTSARMTHVSISVTSGRQRRRNVRRFLIPILLCLFSGGVVRGQNELSPLDCLQRLLERDPQIRIQRTNIAEYEGYAQQYRAPFDLQTTFNAQYGVDHSPIISPLGIVFPSVTTGQYQIGVNRQLEFGASVGATVGVQSTRILDGTSDDTRPQNRAIYGLTLGVPLLKNRGSAAMRGVRDEAALVVTAVRNDARAAMNSRAVDAMTAWLDYWYVKRLHEVAVTSSEEADSTVDDVRAFVAADRRTRSDLDQARATSLQRHADLVAVEQRLRAARFQLAVVLGDDLETALQYGLPTFLDLPSDTLAARELASRDVRMVAERERPDLAAFLARREAARRSIEGLERASDPQLDLGLTLGANGFNFRSGMPAYISPYTENVTPLNINATLTWAFPVENSAARGALATRTAQAERTATQERDLRRVISINAELATTALKSAEHRLSVAREGLELARHVYLDEEFRVRNDASTLVQLRQMQDNVIGAEQTFITAKRDYYAAVLQLRFLTSSFFRTDGTSMVIDATNVFTVPKVTP